MRNLGKWYDTDPDDPEAPIRLTEYNGLKDGMRVRYENPHAGHQLEGPLTVSALFSFEKRFAPGKDEPGRVLMVQAILNDGEYECNADNLVEEKEESNGKDKGLPPRGPR
jgi:hypothetical protein